MPRLSWTDALVILGLCGTLSTRAAAVAPEIKDEAKFFSAEAIKKANEEIRVIARKYDKDVLIETFLTIPANQADKVRAMTGEERSKFFRTWARERVEAKVVRGVFILICKTPGHVTIEVTPQSGPALEGQITNKLSELLLARFREKKFDEGLAGAVKLIGDRLAGK